MQTANDSTVQIASALTLGWALVEIYEDANVAGPSEPLREPPPHLPSASAMAPYEKTLALISKADAAFQSLRPALGETHITLNAVQDAVQTGGHIRSSLQSAMYDQYTQLQDALSQLANPSYFTAFSLGRMLADTALLPHSGDPAVLVEQFQSHRLWNAYKWLDDLEGTLPPGAASAVSASLMQWETWVTNLSKQQSDLASCVLNPEVIRRLREQGRLWLHLLSGDKDAKALLTPESYVEAASGLLKRTSTIAGRFARHWWWFIAITVVAMGAILYIVNSVAPSGPSKVIALLVSAGGALGITWRGVGSTLGKTLSRAESYLWEAEVAAAVGAAATRLPLTPRPIVDRHRVHPNAGTDADRVAPQTA